MNELDKRIQAALEAATELPASVPEPTITEEILETFRGRHSWIMISGGVKMALASILMVICAYQFFQQDTMMAMLAYATLVTVCAITSGCVILFLWVQMNHNTTVREIKRLELQIALLLRQLSKPAAKNQITEKES